MKAIEKTKFTLVFLFVLSGGCGNVATTPTVTTDISETGQQVGDVMASIDESGGSGGSLALMESSRKVFARLTPSEIKENSIESFLMPSAFAASCATSSTFSSCVSNVITRTFDGCTIGSATFSGTVTLTWSDTLVNSICQMAATGHSVTRVPDFTITGRRGATLKVTKNATVGQVITKTAAGFDFTNDGIRRVFTSSDGTKLFDYTTQTVGAIGITGTSRSNRVLSGGILRVIDNLTDTTCDYTPTNVAWTSGCNCPTSGNWSGTCSDGSTTSLEITSCGEGTLLVGTSSESFSFDRCYGI